MNKNTPKPNESWALCDRVPPPENCPKILVILRPAGNTHPLTHSVWLKLRPYPSNPASPVPYDPIFRHPFARHLRRIRPIVGEPEVVFVRAGSRGRPLRANLRHRLKWSIMNHQNVMKNRPEDGQNSFDFRYSEKTMPTVSKRKLHTP